MPTTKPADVSMLDDGITPTDDAQKNVLIELRRMQEEARARANRQGNTEEQLINWFTYHAPEPSALPLFLAIREAALNLARVIANSTPFCADQSAAIRLVRQAVMQANSAIACKGK